MSAVARPARQWLAIPEVGSLAAVAMLAFRWLTVGCMAATFLITWPLWEVHESPPMLPAVDLPAYNVGPALLASLAVILVLPLPGTALLTGLLLYAMAIDQTRIQPEVVSLLILLWGTLPVPSYRAVARAHLCAMWFFAGFNKLFSPDFHDGTAQWLMDGLIFDVPAWVRDNAGYVIGFTELGIGVLAIVPRTRKVAAVAAFGLHVGILEVLSPRGHDWNEAVWPWNVALAFAGFAFIWPWNQSLTDWFQSCHRVVRPLLVVLLIAPLGFYVGVTDAYLAHNLYSSNVARAQTTGSDTSVTWSAFNVPMPPERRLFKQYFKLTCQPGDIMVITDTRWWYRRQGLEEERFTCPARDRRSSG
jgi:Methylamine utilisation protein MauE